MCLAAVCNRRIACRPVFFMRRHSVAAWAIMACTSPVVVDHSPLQTCSGRGPNHKAHNHRHDCLFASSRMLHLPAEAICIIIPAWQEQHVQLQLCRYSAVWAAMRTECYGIADLKEATHPSQSMCRGWKHIIVHGIHTWPEFAAVVVSMAVAVVGTDSYYTAG